eukprot:7314812-Alexandrium_andersonii.AAC.1
MKATCKVAGHGNCACWVSCPADPSRIRQREFLLAHWLLEGVGKSAAEHRSMATDLKVSLGMSVRRAG